MPIILWAAWYLCPSLTWGAMTEAWGRKSQLQVQRLKVRHSRFPSGGRGFSLVAAVAPRTPGLPQGTLQSQPGGSRASSLSHS